MGDRYGALTVVEEFNGGKGSWDVRCRCICDCGNEYVALRSNLRAGRTKSCGCIRGKLKSEANSKRNSYEINGELAIGKASNTGSVFYIDLDVLPLIEDRCWYETSTGYLASDRRGKRVLLHRLIMGEPEGLVIDHLNHNKHDNRKANLRICLQIENSNNRACVPKGVTEVNRGNNTYYIVQLHGYRGCFTSCDDAIELRNKILREEYLIMGRQPYSSDGDFDDISISHSEDDE